MAVGVAYFCSITGSALRHPPPEQGLPPTIFCCSAQPTICLLSPQHAVVPGSTRSCLVTAKGVLDMLVWVCVCVCVCVCCDPLLCMLALMKIGGFLQYISGVLNCVTTGLHADLKKDSGLL